jgi:alpha-L-rhamnosidase
LVGVPILTEWAIQNKAVDFFYTMLKKRDYPGYLNMIDNGATTTWEYWSGERSRIHNCYNGVGTWFYQAVGGVRPDENNQGYKHVFIEPQIPDGVTWAKTTKETPCGTIAVDWQLESSGKLSLNVSLPVGITATVIPPEKAKSCFLNGKEMKGDGKTTAFYIEK